MSTGSNWLEASPPLSGSKRSRPASKSSPNKKPATPVTMSREQLLQCDREQFDSFVKEVTNGRKLTREERGEVSRQRKLIKNRRTAAVSRQRKKDHQNQVEESIQILTLDQELHREALTKLEADNDRLRNEINYMNHLIQQNPIAQTIWRRQEQARKQWHLASPGMKLLARYLLIVVLVAHLFFLQAPMHISTQQALITARMTSTRADSPTSLPGEFPGAEDLDSPSRKLEIPLERAPSIHFDEIRSLSDDLRWDSSPQSGLGDGTPLIPMVDSVEFLGQPPVSRFLNSSLWDNRGPSLLCSLDSDSSPSSESWGDSSPSSLIFSDDEFSSQDLPVKEEEVPQKSAEGPVEEQQMESFQDWLDDISNQSNGTTSFGNYSTFEEFYNSLLTSMASSLCSPPLSRRDHYDNNLPY